jgi:hypothetical protein
MSANSIGDGDKKELEIDDLHDKKKSSSVYEDEQHELHARPITQPGI